MWLCSCKEISGSCRTADHRPVKHRQLLLIIQTNTHDRKNRIGQKKATAASQKHKPLPELSLFDGTISTNSQYITKNGKKQP